MTTTTPTTTPEICDQVLNGHATRILSVYVDEHQVGAAVEQTRYDSDDTFWQITSFWNRTQALPTLDVRDETVAREWLQFLGALALYAPERQEPDGAEALKAAIATMRRRGDHSPATELQEYADRYNAV